MKVGLLFKLVKWTRAVRIFFGGYKRMEEKHKLFQLPKPLTPREIYRRLEKLEFPIENMGSAAGFWFRPCSERHWGMRGEYLVEPPRVEEESAPPSRRGRKGESRYARRPSS